MRVPDALSPAGMAKLLAHSKSVYHLWAATRDPAITPERRRQIRELIDERDIEAIWAIYEQDKR